jgi:hypothetical protein
MTLNRVAAKFALVALAVLCAATMAFAGTIRGSSGNGEDGGAPNWLLLGRSQSIPLTANGKKATMTREIICLNQDVENSRPSPTLTLSGSCDTGDYMYLFQFQSTSANVGVSIGKLSGFDFGNVINFGVMRCDSPTNTIEMCTNDDGTHIPNFTTSTTKTSVTFTVPNTFPTYPAGTAQQGQGLTFFVITSQQAAPLPISLPTVGIR